MGPGGIVADGLDGKRRVDAFVCMMEVRWWRGISLLSPPGKKITTPKDGCNSKQIHGPKNVKIGSIIVPSPAHDCSRPLRGPVFVYS